jgi:Yip1-like protein
MTIDSSGPEAPPPPVPPAKPNGLATYFGILFSPGESFATLARTPMWGWAAIIGIAIVLIASIVSMPEIAKLAQIAQMHAISQLPSDQQADARQRVASAGGFISVFIFVLAIIGPWIGWLIAAVVFLVGALIGKAAAQFDRAWTVAVNIFCAAGIGQLVNAVILALRGPDGIASQADVYAIPSLAMLAQGNPKLAAALFALNPFYLWYYVIAAIGLQIVMKMRPAVAWGTTIVFALIGVALAAAFAK